MCERRLGGERERDTEQERLKIELEILIKSFSHILVCFYPFIQNCPWG